MDNRPAPPAHTVGLLPARNPKVAARVIAGEAMILTPHDSILHTLDPIATRVWDLLAERRTLEEVAALLAEEYDVTPAIAAQDVLELVDALVEKQILDRPTADG